MTGVRYLVAGIRDRLPDSIFKQLFSYMDDDLQTLRELLGVDRSHSAAAYCLRQLIESRKTQYQLLEGSRRDRT